MQAWKSDGTIYSMSPPSNMPAVGAMWYKTILQNASCSNAAKPQGWGMGTDSLNWAVVIPAGSKGIQVRAISNNVVLQTAPLVAGLNFGSPIGVQPGVQMLQLLDGGGNIIMLSTSGKCVSSGCPDGIFNMNYQVLGLAQGTRAGGGCS